MDKPVRIHLDSAMFSFKRTRIIEFGTFSVDCFRYASGVEAVEVRNELGGCTVLPYHGQQIWRCDFLGRELTMKSMFEEPTGSREYLENYGGFLLHCGATAMGVPSSEDIHPLHGDLPNAPYQSAQLLVGERQGCAYVSVCGTYEHRIAFNYHYTAQPVITLQEGSSLIDVEMHITNLRGETMPLMYMIHVNHRPEDDAELCYTAPKNPDAVRIHNSVPEHIKSQRIEELKVFMNDLESDPTLHHVLKPDLPLDPEVVFSIDYLADSDGWAHTLLKFVDGHASYVAHRPEELAIGIRWLSRKVDEEAAGIVLPATAEHNGYTAESAKGNVQYLDAGGRRVFHLRTGLLAPNEVESMCKRVEQVIDVNQPR
jgi:hypothetical protein